MLDVLPKRFAKFGLTLHPEKTRLVPFERPQRSKDDDGPRPGTFDFLGFTHHWGLSQKGKPVVQRRTATSRLSRALKRVYEWCRDHRHWRVVEQAKVLGQKLRGHCAYYGITGNSYALRRFANGLLGAWYKWLHRRSQRHRRNGKWFGEMLRRVNFPTVKCVHSVLRPAANP